MVNEFQRIASARVGAVADLLRVFTSRLSAEITNPAADPPFDYEIQISPAYDFVRDESQVDYSFAYEVAVQAGGISIAQIEASVVLAYSLPADFEVSDDEIEAFGSTSALFAAHPYAREVMQSLTVRLGLPPLTLDVMRFPIQVDQSPQDRALTASSSIELE